MFKNYKNDFIFHLFLITAVAFFGLAIFGGIQNYSPVPYWDMWDGYINFFVKVSEGDWSVWWAQHNEHRILLARLLFWLDIKWFGGTSLFLIVVNYIFLGLICSIFYVFLKEKCPPYYRFVGLFLIIWLSSWSQYENLTWGFQSQFFLAQLLPLSAFYMLYQATIKVEAGNGYFFAACLFGLMSLGTMANGVLALPLLALYAAATRLGLKRILIFVSLALLGFLVYFSNYQADPHHGSLLIALKENPIGLMQYVLIYIGSPFSTISTDLKVGIIVAQLAGGGLIVGSAYFMWQSLRNIKQSYLELSMLCFILYVGGTAFGTAGGRLALGLEQALSSRYATPALMAWAAFFVILAPCLIRMAGRNRHKLWIPILAVSLIILPVQLKSLNSKTNDLFEREISALAVELRIKDQQQIANIYPSAEAILAMTERATATDISIFGNPLIKDVHEQIGLRFKNPSLLQRNCEGNIDALFPIDDNDKYIQINGWIFDMEKKSVPKSLYIVDNNSVVVGYALTGKPRPDVGKAVDSSAVNSGFKGYMLAKSQGLSVKLVDQEDGCILLEKIPKGIFRTFSDKKIDQLTVSSKQILHDNKWLGADFQKSILRGLTVFGSFINSDEDTGSISMKLKRGDRLLYRSGPTAGRQFVKLNNDNNTLSVLPVASEWKTLEFSHSTLPENFVITVIDEGSGWGEWSAIAVLN